MNKTIMMLGAGPYQLAAIKTAKRMGYRVVAVDGDPNSPGLQLADVSRPIDLRDIDGCIATARDNDIDGVVSISTEVAIETVAVVAEELGLCSISVDAARAVTDKHLMRNCLATAGVPCPISHKATSLVEGIAIAKRIGFPLIVKPVDSAASRGVSKVESLEEVADAFAWGMEYSRKKVVVFEEFMVGTEATIEAFTLKGETSILAISEKEKMPFSSCIAKAIHFPALFPISILQEIEDIVKMAINVLGITCGPTHTEVMVTENGVKIVEVGARGGGCKIFTDVVPLASGVSIIEATLAVALREQPDLRRGKSHFVTLGFFNHTQFGKLSGIFGLEVAKKIAGVHDIVIDAEIGKEIKPIQSDVDRPGFYITKGENREQTIRLAREVEALIRFDVGDGQ